MIWQTRGKVSTCDGYRIVSCVRGHEVWYHGQTQYACLMRELPTLRAAQAWAEAHKAQSRESA